MCLVDYIAETKELIEKYLELLTRQKTESVILHYPLQKFWSQAVKRVLYAIKAESAFS